MRSHPTIDAEILRLVTAFGGRLGVCGIVLAHHERFYGTGIPIGARIVAVADALSAMTENRPYRTALSVAAALAEAARGAGLARSRRRTARRRDGPE